MDKIHESFDTTEDEYASIATGSFDSCSENVPLETSEETPTASIKSNIIGNGSVIKGTGSATESNKEPEEILGEKNSNAIQSETDRSPSQRFISFATVVGKFEYIRAYLGLSPTDEQKEIPKKESIPRHELKGIPKQEDSNNMKQSPSDSADSNANLKRVVDFESDSSRVLDMLQSKNDPKLENMPMGENRETFDEKNMCHDDFVTKAVTNNQNSGLPTSDGDILKSMSVLDSPTLDEIAKISTTSDETQSKLCQNLDVVKADCVNIKSCKADCFENPSSPAISTDYVSESKVVPLKSPLPTSLTHNLVGDCYQELTCVMASCADSKSSLDNNLAIDYEKSKVVNNTLPIKSNLTSQSYRNPDSHSQPSMGETSTTGQIKRLFSNVDENLKHGSYSENLQIQSNCNKTSESAGGALTECLSDRSWFDEGVNNSVSAFPDIIVQTSNIVVAVTTDQEPTLDSNAKKTTKPVVGSVVIERKESIKAKTCKPSLARSGSNTKKDKSAALQSKSVSSEPDSIKSNQEDNLSSEFLAQSRNNIKDAGKSRADEFNIVTEIKLAADVVDIPADLVSQNTLSSENLGRLEANKIICDKVDSEHPTNIQYQISKTDSAAEARRRRWLSNRDASEEKNKLFHASSPADEQIVNKSENAQKLGAVRRALTFSGGISAVETPNKSIKKSKSGWNWKSGSDKSNDNSARSDSLEDSISPDDDVFRFRHKFISKVNITHYIYNYRLGKAIPRQTEDNNSNLSFPSNLDSPDIPSSNSSGSPVPFSSNSAESISVATSENSQDILAEDGAGNIFNGKPVVVLNEDTNLDKFSASGHKGVGPHRFIEKLHHYQQHQGQQQQHHRFKRPLNLDGLKRSLMKLGSLGSASKDHHSTRGRSDRECKDAPDWSEGLVERYDSSPEDPLIQRCVIVQRDDTGYGLTVSGDNPVYVQSVKPNGAACRAGVRRGDKIIKVNGSLVTSHNHSEVIKLIKAGPYASLTLLGRPLKSGFRGSGSRHSSGDSTMSPGEILPHKPLSSFSGVGRGQGWKEVQNNGGGGEDRVISKPQAVDHDKDLEYRVQKIATIRMMQDQVQKEYEKMKHEYQKNPTEQIQLRLEVKLQMLRRVEDQLKLLTSEAADSALQVQKSLEDSRETSADHVTQVKMTNNSSDPIHRTTNNSKDPSFRPTNLLKAYTPKPWTSRPEGVSSPVIGQDSLVAITEAGKQTTFQPSRSQTPDHGVSDNSRYEREVEGDDYRVRESISSTNDESWVSRDEESALNEGKGGGQAHQKMAEVSESFSHQGPQSSESTRGHHHPPLPPTVVASNPTWSLGETLRRKSKLRMILPNQVKVLSVEDEFSTPRSSPSQLRQKTLERASPRGWMTPSAGPRTADSYFTPALDHQQVNVISMEDEEFSSDEETVEEPGVFSDLNLLKHRPGHLAVFIHYLMSNSDPSPLLFYIVTEYYQQGSQKDLRKWAYEIHSTFLCDKSPLKVNVDDVTVAAVDGILQFKSDREDMMRSVFHPARNIIQAEISDLLADFRMKCSLGLGSIYGNHELKDVMDRQTDYRVIESTIWKHFERLEKDERSDRNQALAFALAAFFKQVGYPGAKNSSALERCQTFLAKDRKVFKFKTNKKIHYIKCHQFTVQQYFTTTYCQHCTGILWGIGHQGYQCVNCEANVHKTCVGAVLQACTGSASKKKKERVNRPQSIFGNIIKRNLSTTSPAAIKEASLMQEESGLASPTPQLQMRGGGNTPLDEEYDSGCGGEPGFQRTLSLPSVHEVGVVSSPVAPPPRTSASTYTFRSILSPEEEFKDTPRTSSPRRFILRRGFGLMGGTQGSGGGDCEGRSPDGDYRPLFPQLSTSSPHHSCSPPPHTGRGATPLTTTISPPPESSEVTSSVGRSESLNSSKSETRASIRRTRSDVADQPVPEGITSNSASGSSSSSSISAKSSDGGGTEGCPATADPQSHAPQYQPHLHPSHIHRHRRTGSGATACRPSQALVDSDLETETELPPLDAVIPREQLRKLKPKEKKRQDVINELFYTERAHVRNLKVMQRLFYQPMCEEPWISAELVALLFPNIDDMIDVHSTLNNDFKKKKEESAVVGDIARVLVNHFSGDEGERWKEVAAKFCQHQSQALEMLRVKQRKDSKLTLFLQDAASHPLCRRLELKDLIPTEMQRLTKYPLLIESLLHYTQSNTQEYTDLTLAHDKARSILNHVNQRVQECENHQKLIEIQKRLDKRPIEHSTHPLVTEYKKLDLSRHYMIYDGPLTWRISKNKQIDLHVVLLRDILVLLQRQDDRYVLRCQSTNVMSAAAGGGGVAGGGGAGGAGGGGSQREDTKLTHSPIIKLTNLLTRNVATDKRAFFLVSTSDVGPQIYELVANSRDEKERWFKNITEQAETRTREAAKAVRKPSAVVANNGTTSTSSSSEPRESRSHDGSDKDAETARDDGAHSFSESLAEKKVEGEERGGQGGGSLDNVASVDSVEVLHIEQPSLVQPSEVIISSAVCMEQLKTEVHQQPQQLGSSSGEPVGSLLEALKEKIEETMKQKQNLTADIFQIPISDYYNIADMVSESGESTSDIKELLLVSLTQVDLLTQLINKRLSPEPEAGTNFEMTSRRQKIQSDESEYSTENDDESLPTPTPEGSRASDPALSDSAHGSSRSPVSHQPSSRGSPISEGSSSVPIVMSSAQLKKISTNLHRHLSRLMEVILKRDEERAHLQTELSRIQNQITASLRAATAKRSQSSSGPGRPARRRPPPPSLALASVSEHSLASQSGGAQPLNEASGKAKPGSRPQSGRSEGGIQSEDDWSSRPSSWMSAGSSSEGILDVGDETDHSEPSATLVPVPVVMERLEVVEAGTQQSLENLTGADTDLKEQSDLYSDTNKPNNSGSR